MYDIIIVGGGIVGLATGVKLLYHQPDLRLLIIEKETELAAHQTGHNSGVIHAGIYYKPGSLKARNCRSGVGQLLDFCRRNEVEYDLCGKVIVATGEEEIPRLENLFQRGQANGVPDLKMVGTEQLAEIEPHAAGVQAIISPSTGVVDFAAVCQAYSRVIEKSGGKIKLATKVEGIVHSTDGITLETTAGDFSANLVINCAGLYSDKIARLGGAEPGLKIVPFRGEYYTIKKTRRQLVKSLIYPVPDPRFPFLGVHFTRGIDQEVEAGPNAVLAFAREGYRKTNIKMPELLETVTYPAFWKMAFPFMSMGMGEMYRSFWKPAFVRALQKLVPEITAADLTAGGAGVRAQALFSDGRLSDDFAIVRHEKMINILNAPSPAATASLSIGESIAELALN